MILTLEPWLFHLLLSLIILMVTFLLGLALHSFMKKKENSRKNVERLASIILAVMMASLYLFVTEVYTDRASQGERVLSVEGTERIETEQAVIIPFGDYVVLERLYDFGYTVEDEIKGESYRMTFVIEDGASLVDEYNGYIIGNNIFSNRARFAFPEIYEKEWKPSIQENVETDNTIDFPGVAVDIELLS
ncbi:hypothetical protein [Alteribacillus bidgolensis]|uniref:Uncharacterized protein n=1 Tax=Alteribacillus bidgolensis TaxID=930129 RepID=A0A1G8ME29_9BACI|nr:hypothetical protein [Alteribacillus bidgolensis]SDI66208.1 hypothetical protein SAMN05216352_1108 [Alteribacillus bidgolensis]